MKNKKILRIFTFLLVLAAITGCGQKQEKEVTGKDDLKQESNESSVQSIPEIPDVLLKGGWPSELAPEDLPEYTQGTVVNSGEVDGTRYIKIRDTDQDRLNAYLNELKNGGWIVTGSSSESQALKGLYTADFEWQGGGEILQVSVYAIDAGSWPEGDIPPDVLKPRNGTQVGSVEVLNTGENMWYFNYTYDGIDAAAAQEYMETMMESGWEGDVSQLYKSFEWEGKKYSATIEIYETIETRTTFTCNFYHAD